MATEDPATLRRGGHLGRRTTMATDDPEARGPARPSPEVRATPQDRARRAPPAAPATSGLRIVLFGTYDERQHPRVRVLREGLTELGHEIRVVNVPLGFDTASRVRLAAQPWRLPPLLLRLTASWARLLWRSRRVRRPDAVVVGYLGHLDVHLARLRWPRTHLVLDHMVSLAGTVRDRGIGGRPVIALLRLVDRAATRQAGTVVLDTSRQLGELPPAHRAKAVVVPVGAPQAWFDVAEATARGRRP